MFNTGIVAKAKGIIDEIRYNEINYKPTKFFVPEKLVTPKSHAWVGLEKIIQDVIDFSAIRTESALEFGVEFGYSTAALANFFKEVVGVDIFTGDIHAGHHGDIFELTKNNLREFKNIQLVKADFRSFIKDNEKRFDLIHVDIVHTYQDTFDCGLWSVEHSECTIFHDTQSHPEVKRAVADIARKTARKFYNYRQVNGLGIIIK